MPETLKTLFSMLTDEEANNVAAWFDGTPGVASLCIEALVAPRPALHAEWNQNPQPEKKPRKATKKAKPEEATA